MTETQFWIAEFIHEATIIGALTIIGIALWKVRKNMNNWLDNWFK